MDQRFKGLIGLPITIAATNNNYFRNLPRSTPSLCPNTIGKIRMQRDQCSPFEGPKILTACTGFDGISGAGILVTQAPKSPAIVGLVTTSRGSEQNGEPFGDDNFTGGPLLIGETSRL